MGEKMPIPVIFDADDTLWHTEFLYDEARAIVVRLIAEEGMGEASDIEERSRNIDANNYRSLGLSRSRFPKSMVDTYNFYCHKKHLSPNPQLQEAIHYYASAVFDRSTPTVEDARRTLEVLRANGCTLYMWTQGDAAIQERRIHESGLRGLFHEVTITPLKSASELQSVLAAWRLDPSSTWLVGNSIRSDINPALSLKLRAIWIPANVWDREREPIAEAIDPERFHIAETITSVPDIILPQNNATEIRQQAEDPDAVAYLFVSAYHNLYRQYVLDILAYPRDFIFSFPYDASRWLPKPYRDSKQHMEDFADLLAGKDAMIVYVDDRTEGDPRRSQCFLPIRTATILSPALTKGGMIHMQFALGDYVVYDDDDATTKYDGVIKTLASRPRPNLEDCAYVSIGPTYRGRIQVQADPASDDDAWQSTIERLGRVDRLPFNRLSNPLAPPATNPFARAMFLRVVNLEELSSNNPLNLKELLHDEAGFELRGSRNYRLNLLFYYPSTPHYLVRRSSIQVDLTSDFLHGIGSTLIPLNFRYDRRHIDFVTDRVFSDVWTSITLRTVEPPSSAESLTHPLVVAPSPSFLVRIKQTRWVSIVAPIAFATATIAAALSDRFAALLASPLGIPVATLSPIIAILASGTATFILFYMYGRLK